MGDALYLIDADTNTVSMGPVSYDPTDLDGHADQIAAHSDTFPHRRFVVAPHPGTESVDAWEFQRQLVARHGLPAICNWAQVTVRERPADGLFTGWREERCCGRAFCPTQPLRLVMWTLRDQRTHRGQPHTWWRNALCNDHLGPAVERLVDRCLNDPAPDSPRHVGVLVPVAAAVDAEAGAR